MAKNGKPGGGRVGQVKGRSQVKHPLTGNWTKRNTETGRFMDQKQGGAPFKSIRTVRSIFCVSRACCGLMSRAVWAVLRRSHRHAAIVPFIGRCQATMASMIRVGTCSISCSM